jgi:hypothetical protein
MRRRKTRRDREEAMWRVTVAKLPVAFEQGAPAKLVRRYFRKSGVQMKIEERRATRETREISRDLRALHEEPRM